MPASATSLPLLALLALTLAGCATSPPGPPFPAGPGSTGLTWQEKAAPGGDALSAAQADDAPAMPTEPAALLAILKDQARDWRGVPYQWGGLSEDGVDCSGLVYLTFVSRLGVEVPRTTAALARQGRRIPEAELRPGDLVFFRTGRNQRHVGIYMGKGRFLHASSSRGVRVSSLHNAYWRAHFREARRIPVSPSAEAASLAGGATSE